MPGAELRGFAAAVAFLTRVPVGRWVELDAADVARGGALFPLVGAGIGTVVGGIAQAAGGPLSAPVAALLGVAAGTALTGVLHLDALADTADALSASTRERALEIMRDHAVGAYGAAALVLDIGLKAVALAALVVHHDALRAAVCAAAAARAVPVVLSVVLPYARPSAGLGRVLGGTGWARALVAVATAVVLCVLLHAAVLLAVVAGIGIACGVAARNWLGGVTGDVLGAAAELAETGALVAAVALL
ncbi:MAG TPA: adenosylcobinamide-GDP ribazoletransferase [Gaiellaceae bacterium]